MPQTQKIGNKHTKHAKRTNSRDECKNFLHIVSHCIQLLTFALDLYRLLSFLLFNSDADTRISAPSSPFPCHFTSSQCVAPLPIINICSEYLMQFYLFNIGLQSSPFFARNFTHAQTHKHSVCVWLTRTFHLQMRFANRFCRVKSI